MTRCLAHELQATTTKSAAYTQPAGEAFDALTWNTVVAQVVVDTAAVGTTAQVRLQHSSDQVKFVDTGLTFDVTDEFCASGLLECPLRWIRWRILISGLTVDPELSIQLLARD